MFKLKTFSSKFIFLNLFFYFIITLILASISISSHIFSSLFWLFLLIYLIFYLKYTYIPIHKTPQFFFKALVIELIYLLITFCLGYFLGFSKSPFSHNLLSILSNIIIFVIPLISSELARHILVNNNSHPKYFYLITLIFILTSLNYPNLFLSFSSKELFFKYFSSTVMPLILKNILFTYLTKRVSLSVLLTFSLFDSLSLILLPLIPSFNSFTLGSIHLLKLILIYLSSKYLFLKSKFMPPYHKSYLFITYAFTLIIATTLVFFFLGFLTLKPIAIKSNSMFPIFKRGDMLIYTSPPSPKKLTPGDILIFKKDDLIIAHRLVKIELLGNTYIYYTKGDNNNIMDKDYITYENILGVYRFSFKYLGYPAIWLQEYLSR